MSESSTGQTLVKSERGPGRNYDLYPSPNPTELHADGSAGVAIGPAISKLDFHKVVRVDTAFEGGPLETRERHISLVMPTQQLIEFLVLTLGALMENRAGLVGAMEASLKSVNTMLDGVSIRK